VFVEFHNNRRYTIMVHTEDASSSNVYAKQSEHAPIGRWLPDLQITRCMKHDYQVAVISNVVMDLGCDASRTVGDCLILDPTAASLPWTAKLSRQFRLFATEFDAMNWIRDRRKLDTANADIGNEEERKD
jgi:hypothetical protein